MGKIKILSKEDIKKILTLPMAVDAVEQAYLQKSQNQGELWPMVFHEFVPGAADLDIKSGNLNTSSVFGLKLVSWFGDNPKKELPALFGTALIFDLATGEPRALLNAGAMTDYRTGAAGAIGARYLARSDSKTLLMAGSGGLAPYLIAATLLLMPGITKVLLCNPHTTAKAAALCEEITRKVDCLLEQSGTGRTGEILAVSDLEPAVKTSDIIITATPAYQPFIKSRWVQPGTHISCVGADLSGKQEIESAVLGRARVIGDDRGQCLAVGECEKPYSQQVISGLAGEIGDVISGKIPGRTSPDEITVFDSTGIALQDISCGAMVLEEAEKQGIGLWAEL